MQHGRRTTVVTGAGSGIGRATALVLAGANRLIAAADVDGQAVTELARSHPYLTPFQVDVASQQSVDELAAAVSDQLSSPYAVVNCAGWDETHQFLDTDPGFWERVTAINYLGAVRVTHAFLGAMLKSGSGRVVNIASDAGRVGSSGEAVYAGAKGGVIAFSKSVARETAGCGVTVNVVSPGPTDTPLFRRQPEPLQRALERAIPMKRLASPEDPAHAIAYFLSDEAAYVTGQVLSVSGGLTMHG